MIRKTEQVTPNFENSVIELYNKGYGVMELTKNLNTTKYIINKILRRNNIALRKRSSKYHINDKTKDKIINLYNNGYGTVELSKKMNIGRSMIQTILKSNNIQLRKNTPRTHYNINFFDDYNPESCYWAGFIAADGYLRKNRNLVSIKLGAKDINHLKKLSYLTNYSGDVDEEYNYCLLAFAGEWFYNKLQENYDIFPQKSNIIYISSKIPTNYLNHYIRGYFDGDGCITKTTCPTISFTSGSQLILQQLIDLFYNDLGIRLKTKNKKPVLSKNKIAISYSGKNSKIILDWMYNNSYEDIRLDRKHKKYLEIFY